VLRRFIDTVTSSPNHIAIIVEDKSFTYGELFQISKGIAQELESIGAGKFVGLYTDNNVYTYASIVGILLSGRAFVPLNSKFPDDRLKNIIAQTELSHIIGCNNSSERMSLLMNSEKHIYSDLVKKVDVRIHNDKFDTDSIAYILFTSGSTGEPKGIPITWGNFSSFLGALLRKYPLEPQTKVLQCFELSFDVSIACTFLAFSSASTLVVSSLNGIIAVNAFKTIVDHQVEFVSMAPSAISYLRNYKLVPQFKVPFVKTTVFTGEALPFDVVELWKQSAQNSCIDNAYGPTEVTVWSYFYTIHSQTSNELINGLCPIGEPLEGVVAKINPEDKNDLTLGELMLSGNHVFSAYWKNEEKTKQVLVKDNNGVTWYKTGDLVKLNENNQVIYINRLDNQVKINGYRVELGEIEYAIRNELPGSNVAVVLANDKSNNQQLIAFVDKQIDNQEVLLNKLKQSLTFYMLPKKFICLDALPLNANGKIDRKALQLSYV
jgi:D-alanine--poly(phosphoribitol) ligase subunit 1